MTNKYPQRPFGELRPGTMFTHQGSPVHIALTFTPKDAESLGTEMLAADCVTGLVSRWDPELDVTVVKDPELAFGLGKSKKK